MILSMAWSCNRYLKTLVGMLVVLFTYGCGDQHHDLPNISNRMITPADSVSFELPEQLSKFEPNTLTAEVIIDGGRKVLLTVDWVGKTVKGRVDNLTLGNHTFEIVYYISGVKVYTATSLPIRVEANKETGVSFTADMLRYPDNDADGITNLAELQADTNPDDPISRPPAEIPRYSNDYTMVDVVAFSLTEGIASSTDYETVVGFSLTAGISTSTDYIAGSL